MSETTPPVAPATASDASPAPAVETVSGESPVETAATTTAPADPASEPATAETQQPKSRAQERIEDLAQTNKILREHNEFLRQAIERGLKPADAPAQPAAPAATPAAPAEIPMPTLESCGYDVNLHAAELAKWTRAEIDRGVKAGVVEALSSVKTEAVAQDLAQARLNAANEFRKTHRDFDLLMQNPALPWTPAVVGVLEQTGAESPAIAYHLAKNPDQLTKISRMNEKQQLLALGRIQAELKLAPPAPPAAIVPPKAPAAPAAKTSTNAPPPPTPVGGNASPEIDPMTLSTKEWAALRRAELAEKRARSARPAPRTIKNA